MRSNAKFPDLEIIDGYGYIREVPMFASITMPSLERNGRSGWIYLEILPVVTCPYYPKFVVQLLLSMICKGFVSNIFTK